VAFIALAGRADAGDALSRLLGFLRELLPQDLKFEIEYLDPKEAIKVAQILAAIIGRPRAPNGCYHPTGMANRFGRASHENFGRAVLAVVGRD
jgi:hypothetical protein